VTAATTPLERVRALCLALPGATERVSHGSPAFFAPKQFCAWVDDHHGDGHVGVWLAQPPGAQAERLGREEFFLPPYVGGRGWVGLDLDDRSDWAEVAELVEDAFRAVAGKRALAELDAR
jgi:hypothetical protein